MWSVLFLAVEVSCFWGASGAEPSLNIPGSVGSLGPSPSLEDQRMPAPFGAVCVGGPVSRSEQGKPGL